MRSDQVNISRWNRSPSESNGLCSTRFWKEIHRRIRMHRIGEGLERSETAVRTLWNSPRPSLEESIVGDEEWLIADVFGLERELRCARESELIWSTGNLRCREERLRARRQDSFDPRCKSQRWNDKSIVSHIIDPSQEIPPFIRIAHQTVLDIPDVGRLRVCSRRSGDIGECCLFFW